MLARIIITLILMSGAFTALAQGLSIDNPGDGRINYYKGYYMKVDESGDSIPVYVFTDLYCYPPLKFKNNKEKQEYDRLVRNIKVTLPYAKLIAETLIETYEYIETFPTQKRARRLSQDHGEGDFQAV